MRIILQIETTFVVKALKNNVKAICRKTFLSITSFFSQLILIR